MSRFAFNPVPEVAPTGAPGNDYEHIVANPDMFGGAIAGATQKLGGAVEHVGEKGLDYLTARQHLTNEISASETNTWLARNLTDKFNDFGRLQGKAAQDALPKFKQDTEDLYKQTIENAGENLQMQAMLAKSGRFLTDKYYQLGTSHADHQWRTWQDKTADDRAAEFGNQAAIFAQHGTWDDVDIALNTSDDEVRKKLEAKGFDGEAMTAEVKKRRGANVKTIVETLTAQGDPATAQAVFDKYRNRMDAGSVLHVESALKSQRAQLEGRDVADEETGRKPRAGGSSAPVAGVAPSFQDAIKREEGFDPKPRWDVKQWTVGYGTRASGPDEKVDQAEAEKRFTAAVSSAAKIVDGVNPNLDPGTRAAMISLTFNTGDNWTRSGLGEKIRSGDLAGARQLFTQYGNVDGEPNEAVTARRYREASWFGAAEAPAGGPIPTKQQAYDRILARTDGNPLTQNAAIARMNQIYSVFHSEGVQASAAFQLRVRDTTAEAAVTGKVATPLTEAEFVANLGPKLGTAAAIAQYGEYQKGLKLGADMSAVADMSEEQQNALLKQYEPQAGSAGYADAAKRQESLGKAIAQVRTLRAKDPQFKARVDSSIAEAARTGKETTSIPITEFQGRFGVDDGTAAYNHYRASVRLGRDAQNAADLSAQEQNALLASYTPEGGGDDFGEQAKRRDALAKAIDQVNTARNEDPAGFAIAKLPAVKAAAQTFSQVVYDPKSTPELRTAAARTYAVTTLDEQERIGIAPDDRRVVSAAYVERLAGSISASAASEDPQARVGVIAQVQREAAMWGEYWPQVMRQLSPSAQPMVRAIAAGADTTAMTRLLSIGKDENPKKLLKEQNETRAHDLDTNLNTELAPFLRTLVGRQKDRDYTGYFNIAQQLGALYVRDGDDAPTAARKAFNDLLGKRTEFRDTWRMPKSAGVSADDVQAGTEEARATLRRAAGKPLAFAFGIQPAENDIGLTDNHADSLSKFARDGTFVTAPDNGGLNLVYGDKYVRRADGAPVTFSWADLARLGGSPAARRDRQAEQIQGAYSP